MEQLLRRAGDHLLGLRGRETFGPEIDRDIDSLKTLADQEIHDLLIAGLAEIDRAIPVISEEDAGHKEVRPRRYFLIDPVDGTASFAKGFDGFVTQAALMEDDQPVLAAIVAPVFAQVFTAERGRGSWLNGERLSVWQGGDRLILTDNYPEPRGTASIMMQALDATGYLESGSIALKICRVADASADIFFKDVIVRDWDVAPAHLILDEAGGTVWLPDGRPYAYTGDYVKPGVIAARDADLARRTFEALSA
ncbi:MAG: inositol monophosphatase family protein [Magnetovibrionaceae bacterium]